MIAICGEARRFIRAKSTVSTSECGTGSDIEPGTTIVIVEEGPWMDTTARQAEIIAKAAEELEAELFKAYIEAIEEQEPTDWPKICERPSAGIGSRKAIQERARSPPK